MAEPEEVANDYAVQAAGRVLLQYRESPNLLDFIAGLMAPCQNIEEALVTIPALDDIDTATGKNLDVTGELVGQPRGVLSTLDATYRKVIRARILRNKAHGTGEDVLEALSVLLVAPVVVWDLGEMGMGYAVGRILTAEEIAFLTDIDAVARPEGVNIVVREMFDSTDYFGFDDDPNPGADGFLNDVPVGADLFVVRVATAGPLPSCVPGGADGPGHFIEASVNGALPLVDGVALLVGERIFVHHASPSPGTMRDDDYGLYTVTTLGSAGTKWKLTRASFYNQSTPTEVHTGGVVIPTEGTVNTNIPFTLDTWTGPVDVQDQVYITGTNGGLLAEEF